MTTPLEAAAALVEKVREEHRPDWDLSTLTPRNGKTGSVKSWMQAHDGQSIDTLQVNVSPQGVLTNAWNPGPRTLRSTMQATRFWFETGGGHSSREYAGMRLEAVSDTMLVASTLWGNTTQAMIYRVT